MPGGVAREPGQTLAQLLAERTPLYDRYAQHTVDAGAGTADQVATMVYRLLRPQGWSGQVPVAPSK